MNELLAIIIIVLLCCAMFFAWLISMATCPDRMVDLISGTSSQEESPSSSPSTTSKEMISDANSKNDPTTILLIDDAKDDADEKPRKKYSTALLQLGATFAQRGFTNRRTINLMNGIINPNLKKLSVVPEQDEQLTINSKTSQAHYSISLVCVQEPLLEQTSEESQPHDYDLSSYYRTDLPQLLIPSVPYAEPDSLLSTETRCVEDVIDARRRQRARSGSSGNNSAKAQLSAHSDDTTSAIACGVDGSAQLFSGNDYDLSAHEHYASVHNAYAVGGTSDYYEDANHTIDALEADTIFLLPPRYELLHATLAVSDETRDAADAISLPISPHSFSSAGGTSFTTPFAKPTLVHYNSESHLDNLAKISQQPLNYIETGDYMRYDFALQPHNFVRKQRRYSLSYII